MYGAHARRVDAKSAGLVEDVDFYKLGLLCDCERGVAGLINGIYTFGMFKKKCGGFSSNKYGAYVAQSFFDTLLNEVRVEMKVINYVATDAVQAESTPLNEGAGDAFDLKAAVLGNDDKSAFGNKIGYKLLKTEELNYKLASDSTASASTSLTLVNVDNLEVGYFVHIEDGSVDVIREISAIDKNAKTITVADITNVSPLTVANTTVSRIDIKLEIAVKDVKGVWEKQETFERIPFEIDVSILSTELEKKSYYLKAVSLTVTEVDDDAVPADVTTWTALASGSDGTGASASDYDSLVTGFNDSEIVILLAPELSTIEHNQNMIDYANDGYNCMYYANVADGETFETLKEFGSKLRSTINFAIIPADKWFQVDDELLPGIKKNIPNVGIASAHYYNSYSLNGIGKVAAGNRQKVNTGKLPIDNDLIHNDKDGIGDLLIREYSVNICKWREGVGTTINSARTLSTDGGYIFQNQIMGWLLIKRSILVYLETFEQDPSGINAQEVHYRVIWAYLKKKYDEGVFFKGKREDGSVTDMNDAVTIVNDFSINSLADIANGKEEVFVQVIFVPPIEEPILSLASAPVTSI